MKQNSFFIHRKQQSFKTHLMISLFWIALPIVGMISLVSFLVLSGTSKETASLTQATAMEKVANQLANVFDNTENLSRDIIFNPEVQQLCQESYDQDPFPKTDAAAYHINSYISTRDFIHSVVLTGQSHTLFSTEKAFTSISDYQNILQSRWYRSYLSGSEPFYWFRTYDSQDSTVPEMLLVRSVYSTEDYVTKLGSIMIYLNDDYLAEILNGFHYGSTTNLWILDKNRHVLLTNTPEKHYDKVLELIRPGMKNQVIRSDYKEYVVGSKHVPNKDWYIYMVTPYQEVNTSIYTMATQLFLFVIGILFILIFLIIRSVNSVSAPIIHLANVMDSFHGKTHGISRDDLDSSYYLNREDEIGLIYQSYQQMSSRMDTLIQEIYIKNLEKKDAELALLQSQINPHFLYNTLDSINWMALSNDQDEISEMITALSDTFRLSLTKNNSSYVQVKAEVEYVSSYLVLQKFRYTTRLEYTIQVAPDTNELYLPRFILQPVIENALKHGIDSIDGGGHVDLIIRKQEDTLLIDVWNDGIQIDLSQMEALLDFDPEHMELLAFKNKGYGVQNIHRRIRILCGQNFGLTYSIYGNRTCCRICLPTKETDRN